MLITRADYGGVRSLDELAERTAIVLNSPHQAQGKLDAAVDICRKVISLDPKYGEAYSWLAPVGSAQIGRYRRTLRAWRKVTATRSCE